jgi:hypothetical protein
MILKLIIEKLTNRRVDRILEKAVADIKNGKEITDEDLTSLEDKKNGIIEIAKSGFKIISPKTTIYVAWDKVHKIVSFKQDLWTTDQACLGFVALKEESMFVANEEMKGFLTLLKDIEAKKPGFEEKYHSWLFNTPAFDSNIFTLWEEANES